MNDKNLRRYGLDVLRILLAFMVITLHINAGATGKVLSYSTEFPWNIIVGGVTTLCYPAVNCYVLICGFFSWNKNDVKKKLFRLWLSLLFFSILGYMIVCIALNKMFNITELIKRFFPLIRGEWWYMVDYFALVLLLPAINKMIECLSKNQHKKLNILCLILFSVLPMFNKWEDQFGVNYGYGLLWFIALYIIGAYLGKYSSFERLNLKVIKSRPFSSFAILYFFVSFLIMLIGKILGMIGVDFYLNPYNSIFSLIQSLCLFLAFLNLDLKNRLIVTAVKYVAPLSFASYLFHCQEDIDVYIWQLIKPWEYTNNKSIIVVWIAIVIAVFTTSSTLPLYSLRETSSPL